MRGPCGAVAGRAVRQLEGVLDAEQVAVAAEACAGTRGGSRSRAAEAKGVVCVGRWRLEEGTRVLRRRGFCVKDGRVCVRGSGFVCFGTPQVEGSG